MELAARDGAHPLIHVHGAARRQHVRDGCQGRLAAKDRDEPPRRLVRNEGPVHPTRGEGRWELVQILRAAGRHARASLGREDESRCEVTLESNLDDRLTVVCLVCSAD